jgi:AraC-like DNA-binding protein
LKLRVRRSLELVDRADLTLTSLAMRLHFAHHSHFTSAFRREFGVPPSAVRGRLHAPAATAAEERTPC